MEFPKVKKNYTAKNKVCRKNRQPAEQKKNFKLST